MTSCGSPIACLICAHHLSSTADSGQSLHGHPLQRYVSSIGRCVPVGVQLEQRPLDAQQQQSARPASRTKQVQPLLGRLNLDVGRQAQQPRQQQSAFPPPGAAQHCGSPAQPAQPADAEVVPQLPKIRFKLPNAERRASPPDGVALLQTARQLGTGLLLSPLPAGWGEVFPLGPA